MAIVENLKNYYCYEELATNGYQAIHTDEINDSNIDDHWKGIINILCDGIEKPEVQSMKLHVVFPDDECNLYIMQYMYNLMMWTLIVCSNRRIMSYHLFFEEVITSAVITKYINQNFIKVNMKKMELIKLNQNIDRCIGKFRDFENFQMYLCDTLDFKDTIDLMKEESEVYDILHTDISNIPLEDAKEYAMKRNAKLIKYITRADRDHNMKYSFIAKEGTNEKQFKEVCTNIGPKPNGLGGVFKHALQNSFINGGLQGVEELIIDSSIGRIAQILQKQNVGQSGAFARRLGLNNQDTRLHPDPNYTCDTNNLEEVCIKNSDILDMYNMRYYRFKLNGPEYLLDADKDSHLIGQTLYFRSPMTCSSAARGHGICYRCYGDLAYCNRNINIGQIAAELLSAIYTQTLLSAKHLLESAIIKMKWCPEFSEFFQVDFDQIILKEDLDYKKMKLIINQEDVIEDESDTDEFEMENIMEETQYVYSFAIKFPNNDIITIKTEDNDPIYLHGDLIKMMNQVGTNEYDDYELDMSKMADMRLFVIEVQNNELSRTMKQIKNLIDSKATIKNHDRNTILETFIDTNLQGRIKLNAVHFEVLLMNQIRAVDDIIEKPDWNKSNEQYQIIPLEKALGENPSITVRLQGPKLRKTLTNTSNKRLYKPSNMDLFTMAHPQEFMSSKFESSLSELEKDKKVIKPVHFVDKNKFKENEED